MKRSSGLVAQIPAADFSASTADKYHHDRNAAQGKQRRSDNLNPNGSNVDFHKILGILKCLAPPRAG
jgi:hypothetical protein